MVGVPSHILDPVSTDVGVLYVPPTSSCPPLRIFYPASVVATSTSTSRTISRRSVGWFDDTGVVAFLKGYTHVALSRHTTCWFRWFLQPLLYVLALFLPMTWQKIPGLYKYQYNEQQQQQQQQDDEDDDAEVVRPEDEHKQELLQNSEKKSNDNNNNNNNIDNKKKKLPIIFFSHGLTGTGQENTALCTAWAQHGFVVVALHHTDGSSCRVQKQDGTILYYEHGPSFLNYDATFRPEQIQYRSEELMAAYNYMIDQENDNNNADDDNNRRSNTIILGMIRNNVDPKRVVAAGYSYGAATVARTVVKENSPFIAALLLDGWFYIDVQESANIAFQFPSEAFEHDSVKNKEGGLPLPSLFINSQQFCTMSKLLRATQILAGQHKQNNSNNNTTNNNNKNSVSSAKGEQHKLIVIRDTGHQNFCDVIFWFPQWILHRLLKQVFGTADAMIAYQEIVDHSVSFLKQVTAAE